MKARNYNYQNQETLLNGKVQIQLRKNVFYARIYRGERERGYVSKTLKTSDIDEARQKALQFHAEIEHKRASGIPLVKVTFEKVIRDYLAMREAQFKRGNYVRGKKNAEGQQTSVYNLRQMKRKAKFWIEYAGKMAVCAIKDRHLENYVDWRRDYYHRMTDDERPRNHALNPADKTLQDETVFALTVLKWAKKQGYRGVQADVKYYFKAERCTARPSFTAADYAKLLQTLQQRVSQARQHELYMRETLRDLVLVASACGARVGELYSLRETDLTLFTDDLGRQNYRLAVDGKTGKREVVMTASSAHVIDRVLARNKAMQTEWDRASGAASNRKTVMQGNWLFRMKDGKKIIGLVDQFTATLEAAGIKKNARGEDYSLYSLRHTYAVEKLRAGLSVYHISKNMGCSVSIIERYYGSHATSASLATALGG
jgi:integrase